RVDYDDVAMRDALDFRVGDVFFSGILSVASEVLAEIGDQLGRVREAEELRLIAARFRHGVLASVDGDALARDRDRRSATWIESETIAGFAPLLCGATTDDQRRTVARLVDVLRGPRWCGHPDLALPLPPSTSPSSPAFRPRTYWRGPVWPVVSW